MSAAENRKAGHPENAMQILKTVFDTYPDSSEAWMRKGEWLCDDGRWDEGVVALRHSIGLDLPGHFWAHARMGDALIRRGFREEGEVSFLNALAIAPDAGRAAIYHRFSDALVAHGDPLAALRHQELASTLSNEAYIHMGYAQLLHRLGKMSDASIHIQRARERGIDSAPLRALLEQMTATISH
jgi:tetratricopeptide (TPR) repeat protein